MFAFNSYVWDLKKADEEGWLEATLGSGISRSVKNFQRFSFQGCKQAWKKTTSRQVVASVFLPLDSREVHHDT